MSTSFLRRKPPNALTIHLIVISLRPLLVSAQFRTYPPSHTTPTWYIGLTFLLTAILIFAGLSLFYLRQRCLRAVSPASRPGGGLDSAAVEAFPVLAFSDAAGLRVAVGADCAVCLSAFEGDETLRLMPKCGHAFHPGCVDVWLASHTTCPCCRADLSLPVDYDSPSTSSSSTQAIKDSNDVVLDVGSVPTGVVVGG